MKIKLKTIEQIKKEFEIIEHNCGFSLKFDSLDLGFINKKMFKYFGKEIEVGVYQKKFIGYDFFKKDHDENWVWKFSKKWIVNDFIDESEFKI